MPINSKLQLTGSTIHSFPIIQQLLNNIKTMAKKKNNTTKSPPPTTLRANGPVSPDMSQATPENKVQFNETFQLTSVEQLRSVAIPLRISILRLLADKAMTTKQLAEELAQPVTRLYHHIDALLGTGLIVVVQENAKRGTIERYFRAVARSFRASHELLAGGSKIDERVNFLVDLLDQSRTTLLQLDTNHHPLTIAGAACSVNASATEVHDLMDHLAITIKSWESKCAKTKTAKAERSVCRIVICIHPESSNPQ